MSRSALGLMVLLVIVFSASAVMSDTIRMASDNWCPYNCEPDSDKPGYMIEIAKLIFEKAGHQVEYQIKPWSASIIECRKGNIDALPGTTKGEVPDFIFPDESFGACNVFFFTRKGSPWRYKGIESLKGVKVGIQADYEYGERLDAYFSAHKNTPAVQVSESDTPLVANIQKLLKGLIDTIPEDKSVFLNCAKGMNVIDQIQEAGIDPVKTVADFNATKLYMAFSPVNPKSKAYASILSKGIIELRASGELQKILDKYGLTDWQKELDQIKAQLGL